MTTTTALTLWSALAAHSVPREYRGAASMAAMEFFDACAAGQDQVAEEWKRQRSAALPHVPGEGALAGRCLTCGDPYPCDGYIRDIDNGEVPA